MKKTNPFRKWEKDMNRHFTTEDIQMANESMKRCSAALAIKEMQNQTTVGISRHPSEQLKSQIGTPPNADKDVQKLEHPYLQVGR